MWCRFHRAAAKAAAKRGSDERQGESYTQTILLFRAALLSERFEALHGELATTYTKEVKIAA